MASALEPGRVLKGKYRIERVLGEGGMGVVVAAEHLALEQKVAIKFLLPAMLQHREIVERFAREAKAATKIHSDHIARVLDVDSLEDGTPFMVMEYLEGTDLSAVRKQQRPLSVPVAVGYLLEACEAIGEAHRLGIIHRDIKPANLFLARRPDGKTRVKVLDFGISKMDGPGGSTGPSVTRTSSVMGSAEYMSPEQMMASRDVDARSDIWALGVSLYELLTCRVPFPGETITHVCAMVMTQTPDAPSLARPEIPFGLDAVVLKCLEREREHRFGSIAELVNALLPFSIAQTVSSEADTAPVPHRASWSSEPPQRISQGGSGTAILGPEPVQVITAPPDVRSTGSRSGGSPTTNGPISREPSPAAVAVPSRAPVAIGVLALITCMGIGGIWIALHHTSSVVPEPAASAAPAAPTATAEIEIPKQVTPPAPEVMPSAPEPSAVPSESAAAAPSDRPVAHKKTTVTSAPAAAPHKQSCNPPYTVDAQGIRHAKPDCI